MLLLIVLGVLLVAGIVGIIIFDEYNHEGLRVISGITIAITAFSLFIGVAILSTNPYADFYGRYTNVKIVAEQINGVITGTLKDEIIELNEEILVNQQKANNKWNGIYYSEKIAQTPLIELTNN